MLQETQRRRQICHLLSTSGGFAPIPWSGLCPSTSLSSASDSRYRLELRARHVSGCSHSPPVQSIIFLRMPGLASRDNRTKYDKNDKNMIKYDNYYFYSLCLHIIILMILTHRTHVFQQFALGRFYCSLSLFSSFCVFFPCCILYFEYKGCVLVPKSLFLGIKVTSINFGGLLN